jgi:excisionase family DNA binding protein
VAGTELISLALAAEMLHVAPSTLSRWALRGRVPYATTPGGHKRFPRAAVEEMAALQDAPLTLQVRAS